MCRMTSPIGADSAYLKQQLSAKPQRAAGRTNIEGKMTKNTLEYLRSSVGVDTGFCDGCRVNKDAREADIEDIHKYLARPGKEKKRDKERSFDREVKREEQGKKA